MDLFDHAMQQRMKGEAPLAARMRPRTLDEFVGQEEIVGPGKLLRRAIEADRLFSSILLWGPPGTGKTTLAMVIANQTKSHFETLSAVLAGKAELKKVIDEALERRKLYQTRSILFVKRIHRLSFGLLLMIFTAGCDQASKMIARNELASNPPVSFLSDSIRLTYTVNPGAILGFGSQLPADLRFLLFVVFASLLLALVFAFTIKTRHISLLQFFGLCLITGGGAGNLIDRILYQGGVVDFIRLKVGIFQTGIFNLADAAIFLGIAIVLFSIIPKKDDPILPA